jgi:small subunit ribosomal protein S6
MRTRDYEAMFLLDNAACTADYEGTVGAVDQILTRAGATIVQKEKWDERKLAYEIRGHKRATYYLAYFRAPTDAIGRIRGDAALSEKIIRSLVLVLEEPIETHVKNRADERERLAEESRKANLAAGWGERGPEDRPRRRRDDEEGGEGFEEALGIVPEAVEPPEET